LLISKYLYIYHWILFSKIKRRNKSLFKRRNKRRNKKDENKRNL